MHLIATNFYGGPEKQIIEHLKRLNTDAFHGVVASFLEGPPNEILAKANEGGLATAGIPMRGRFDFAALRALSALLDRESVHLLCCHGYKATVMGWWAGKRARIPVLSFSRGYTAEDWKVALYERIERRVLRSLTGIVCVSHGQRRRLEGFGVSPRKTWVVHNAISAGEAAQTASADRGRAVLNSFGIPNDAYVVVAAGRLSIEKGHRYLVEAVARLGSRRRNALFVFCGDGVCREALKAQAVRLGVDHYLRFVGFRRDLADVFAAMDLMVLPSLTEGLPNVVLEAFALGKPVVATAVGGVPEVIEHGVNGSLVPPARADLLADAIAWCLQNPEGAEEQGRAGFRTVEERFGFEDQTRRLEAVYSEVLKGRCP